MKRYSQWRDGWSTSGLFCGRFVVMVMPMVVVVVVVVLMVVAMALFGMFVCVPLSLLQAVKVYGHFQWREGFWCRNGRCQEG